MSDPHAPTAEEYRDHHLIHRIGAMRAPLYYLPILIAEKRQWALKDGEWGALKDGSLIAIRSLLGLLGMCLTVPDGGTATIAIAKGKDCPTNPNPKHGTRDHAIFGCDQFRNADLADSDTLQLLTKLISAGSAAVAHITDKRSKMDHEIKNDVLQKGIEFVSRELRERVFVKNNWQATRQGIREEARKQNCV